MNDHNYNFNPDNARKMGTGGRINATGEYRGVFTRAEAVTSKNNTLGIEFDFKSEDGATALFLSVWTLKADGQELSGRRIVDALMACLRLKTLKPILAVVDKWDNETKAITKQRVQVFGDLMGRQIGLLLQKEVSQYRGEDQEKMLIYGCFDHETGKTPKELVERLPAVALPGIVASLRDYHPKPRKNDGQSAAHNSDPRGPVPDYLDDDMNY